MMRTTTDALDDFVVAVRKACATTPDLVARAEVLRQHLRRLLAIPRWLEELLQLPAQGGFGWYDFYVDWEYGHPVPGLPVMCTVQRPGQSYIPLHDHGASWVV